MPAVPDHLKVRYLSGDEILALQPGDHLYHLHLSRQRHGGDEFPRVVKEGPAILHVERYAGQLSVIVPVGVDWPVANAGNVTESGFVMVKGDFEDYWLHIGESAETIGVEKPVGWLDTGWGFVLSFEAGFGITLEVRREAEYDFRFYCRGLGLSTASDNLPYHTAADARDAALDWFKATFTALMAKVEDARGTVTRDVLMERGTRTLDLPGREEYKYQGRTYVVRYYPETEPPYWPYAGWRVTEKGEGESEAKAEAGSVR